MKENNFVPLMGSTRVESENTDFRKLEKSINYLSVGIMIIQNSGYNSVDKTETHSMVYTLIWMHSVIVSPVGTVILMK